MLRIALLGPDLPNSIGVMVCGISWIPPDIIGVHGNVCLKTGVQHGIEGVHRTSGFTKFGSLAIFWNKYS